MKKIPVRIPGRCIPPLPTRLPRFCLPGSVSAELETQKPSVGPGPVLRNSEKGRRSPLGCRSSLSFRLATVSDPTGKH